MKLLYLIRLMVFAMPWQFTYATETEPNNTSAQANILALNGSDKGKINPAGDVDWWKVTTTADGKLNITLSTRSGKSIRVNLYDSNSTTLLSSGSSKNTFVQSGSGLAAGTYYIKVKCDSASDTANYTISNSLQLPAQANDVEPNNSKAQAFSLPLDTTITGHIGYYYNNKRDSADWYKITTNKDGRLGLTLTPAQNTSTFVYLYDNNGKTLLNSRGSNVTFTLSMDGLAAGTYFVKISCSNNSKFTAYTLTNSLAAVSQANDAEPNNTSAQAITLNLNTAKTGHLGYYYKNKRDSSDWYKITTRADGRLNLTLTPAKPAYVSVYLYDNDGITQLGPEQHSNTTFAVVKDGLAAGTYYVKVNCYFTSNFTPYTLTGSLFKPVVANDTEPNDSKAQALTLNQNAATTGHLGYYYKNKRDNADWYKITTNADGRLNLNLTPANDIYVSVYLYDNDGITQLGPEQHSNTTFTVVKDGLAAGTYYVKVSCYFTGNFTPYTLKDNLFKPLQANDAEPNDSKARAHSLNLNSTATGDVGYYYNHKRDTADWYKITTNADGRLDLNLTPVGGEFVFMYLYDNDGTTLIKFGTGTDYSNAPFTRSFDGLAAGTYYLKIFCYYTDHFTPYVLVNKLVTPSQANDVEPNNTRAQALALNLNSSTTGHVGYYYNNNRDIADWYKITTKGDGLLSVSLTPVNGSFVFLYLYDNDGTTLLNVNNQNHFNGPFIVSRDGLAAGTYYIKVFCYYTNNFTPYILSNSLVKPAVANDTEPNDSRAQALILNINSTATGHVGYYYNNKSDAADWYKITTTRDGMLKLNLTPANGSLIYANLYDNDGTTQLNQGYSGGPFSFNTDGLAAGTYYVRIKTYYPDQFTAYTLTDSLLTYSYANDVKPNNNPYQGKNISPNITVTGHVNFYYNLAKDTRDWWKLNYTGSGDLRAKASPGETIEDNLAASDNNVTVYPNPASNRIRVQVNSKHTNLASVTLKDANGEEVWSESNLAIVKGRAGLDVNVKNYPAGIYFLHLIDVNGKNITKQIIIVR